MNTPLQDLIALAQGLGLLGRRIMAWYGQIAAMILLIALIEAVVFGVSHFQKIRDRKRGWKARLAPRRFSKTTRSSGTMRVAEPVCVAGLILVAGFLVAFVWPLWLPFVTIIVGYDVACCLVYRWKVWRGIIIIAIAADDEEGEDDDHESTEERQLGRLKRKRESRKRSNDDGGGGGGSGQGRRRK